MSFLPFFFNFWKVMQNNIQQEEIGIIYLKPVNVLITSGEIKKTDTLVTTFHKPAGEKTHMSGLVTVNWKFSSTPQEKFYHQLTLTQ